LPPALWQIRRLDAVRYVGRANDVVGQAHYKVDGATFQFAYTDALKPGNRLFHVRLDQTMTLQRGVGPYKRRWA